MNIVLEQFCAMPFGVFFPGMASDDDLDLDVEAKGRSRRFSLSDTNTPPRVINPEVQRNWRASVHNVNSVIQLRKSQGLAVRLYVEAHPSLRPRSLSKSPCCLEKP